MFKVKNCAQNNELVYFMPQALNINQSSAFGPVKDTCGSFLGVCVMGTAAYEALLAQEEEAVQKLQNKRHGEPALTNSYTKQTKKQTNQPPPPTTKPLL